VSAAGQIRETSQSKLDQQIGEAQYQATLLSQRAQRALESSLLAAVGQARPLGFESPQSGPPPGDPCFVSECPPPGPEDQPDDTGLYPLVGNLSLTRFCCGGAPQTNMPVGCTNPLDYQFDVIDRYTTWWRCQIAWLLGTVKGWNWQQIRAKKQAIECTFLYNGSLPSVGVSLDDWIAADPCGETEGGIGPPPIGHPPFPKPPIHHVPFRPFK